MYFNEPDLTFDQLLEKKRAFKKRMETDFDFRMEQVDKKLMTVNAFSGYKKYMRYQATVIEFDYGGAEVDTYQIGLLGEIRKY